MMDFVQRSGRSVGFHTVLAHSITSAGPLSAARIDESDARVIAGPERACARNATLPQSAGDWYERLP